MKRFIEGFGSAAGLIIGTTVALVVSDMLLTSYGKRNEEKTRKASSES